MEKLLIPLPETNFWHDAVKLLMSHSDKADFGKRYKITILVVSFSFGNGYEIYNMHKIMYDIGDDSKAKLENNVIIVENKIKIFFIYNTFQNCFNRDGNKN